MGIEWSREILAGIGERYRKRGFQRTKALISLKRGKMGPRLVLRTNNYRKSYSRFRRLVQKSMALDDLEWSLCTQFQNTCTMVLCCYLFIFGFTFSLLLVDKWLAERVRSAGAITALTFRKLKQITIKESWGVERTRCIARFPCDARFLLLLPSVAKAGLPPLLCVRLHGHWLLYWQFDTRRITVRPRAMRSAVKACL